MSNVAGLLKNKGHIVWSVRSDQTVFDAIKLMDEKEVGALPVIDGNKLVGIISERDYARKVILKDRSSKQTLVHEIMTRNIFHAVLEQDIHSCMATMSKHHIRHLPVLEDNQVIGMISLGDVVKEIIADQQYKIENLEHSISWGESY